MATAEQYAQWIVENKDKKGSPDFDKVVSAYKLAKQQQQTPQEQPSRMASPQQRTWGQVGKEAVGNIPSSAMEFGRNIVQPILHPIDTAKAVGNLAVGAVEKAIPGEQGKEQYADQFADFIKERYGSVDAFKETVAEDPVGVLSDLSMLLTGAGGPVKAAGTVGKVSKLKAAGDVVSRVGRAVEPVNIATNALGTMALKAVPSGAANRMYRSAAKFSTTIPETDRIKMAKTALTNEIMPTAGGVEKTRSLIDSLNKKITTIIDDATAQGKQIPKNAIFKHFNELRKEASTSDQPMKDLADIGKVSKDIDQYNKMISRGSYTPAELQKLKQKIYRRLETQYSKQSMDVATVAAKKTVARTAKELIEELHPEIRGMNAKEGELIDLLDSIEKSASRISNRDIAGIGVPIKGTMGGVMGGTPGAAIGVASGILDTPIVKAKLAIVLDKLKREGIKTSPITTASRNALFQAGRIENQNALTGAP
jgi:predicted RNA-binding protein YlxR (DUF448 family)